MSNRLYEASQNHIRIGGNFKANNQTQCRGWNWVESVKGYNFHTKIKRIEVFMREKWMFEVRVLKLNVLSFICKYQELCENF